MVQLLLLVAFCLLSLCQTLTTVIPTSVPTLGGTKITISGSYFSASKTYTCKFGGLATTTATYLSSSRLVCSTPAVSQVTDVDLSILENSVTIIITPFHFVATDSCYKPQVRCDVFGDPHFTPFCDRSNTYGMQPSNAVINIATSMDGRFSVLGTTTAGPGVTTLKAVSIIGTGSDGQLSATILFDSPTPGSVNVYYNGAERTDLPIKFNGIFISAFSDNWIYATFPGGEIVNWDTKGSLVIYLNGIQYWRNVGGLCGQVDARLPYCIGGNGNYYYPTSSLSLENCADSWTISYLKRFAQESNTSLGNDTIPDDNSTIFYLNDTITDTNPPIGNITRNSTAYVVSDNILTKAAKSICVELFEFLSDLCPANSSQNLPSYQTTCIYDGSALLTNKFEQLSPSTDVDTVSKSFFSNLAILSETILDADIWTLMVASARTGIQDCFYQNLTLNGTNPEFDNSAFLSALPGCSRYCTIAGASCSDDDECQFSLTLGELLDRTSSGSSTIPLNVVLFIGCLLLSIW